MAYDVGILGQADVTLDTDTALYTAPAGRDAKVKVFVAERGGSAATVRIWIRDAAEASANKQYIVYDESIAANEAKVTAPFYVNETDIVMVRANTGNVSFTCVGEP